MKKNKLILILFVFFSSTLPEENCDKIKNILDSLPKIPATELDSRLEKLEKDHPNFCEYIKKFIQGSTGLLEEIAMSSEWFLRRKIHQLDLEQVRLCIDGVNVKGTTLVAAFEQAPTKYEGIANNFYNILLTKIKEESAKIKQA